MFLQSSEIRWFFPQSLPQEVLEWFSAGENLTPERVREDEYLLFPGCDTVGVKLREGKLEVKTLQAASRPLDLDGGITGRTDQWVKWSFGNEGLKTMKEALLESERWGRVSKERFLRKFSYDSGNPVEVQSEEKPLPTSGCNVELTRLRVNADPGEWFSLGFEAFGAPASTAKILDDTLRKFFGEHGDMPGVRLTGRESLSYPAWLATLTWR